MRVSTSAGVALVLLLLLPPPAAAAEQVEGITWRPWFESIFLHARQQRRPVLVYLQAPWCGACRAFEEQVFGDPTVSAAVNDGFVAIRVDLDRRPDVFRRYQRGGLPSVAFVHPSGHAILFQDGEDLLVAGGSRFTPDEMRRYLGLVRKVFDAAGPAMEKAARQRIEELLSHRNRESRATTPEMTEVIGNMLLRAEDPVYGGIQGRRQVEGMPVRAALERFSTTGDQEQAHFARRALNLLARSAVRDPLTGGFYREARSADWSGPVPGFLLVTQADMLDLFLDASVVLGDREYRDVAAQLADLLLARFFDTELRAFRASIYPTAGDGPSWSAAELEQALQGKQLAVAAQGWGLPVAPDESRRAPRIARTRDELAEEMGRSAARVARLQEKAAARMLEVRVQRDAQATDDTVITDWNARAAAALLRASAFFERDDLRDAALVVLDYIQAELTSVADGVFHGMEVRPPRVIRVVLLQDQLAVASAWMQSYELSGDPTHRERAAARLSFILERFREPEAQVFLERLVSFDDVGELRIADRRIEENSWASILLLKMAALEPGNRGRPQAQRVLEAFADEFIGYGILSATYGNAIDRYYHEPTRVLVVEPEGGGAEADRLRRAAVAAGPLWKVVLTARPGEDDELLRSWQIDGTKGAAAWILDRGEARGPLTGGAALQAALAGEE